MKLIQQQTIQESLSVSYQIEKIGKTEIDLFKKNLIEYLSKINPAEHEENAKNLVRDLFRDTFYNGKNDINTKGRIDLAIYQDDQPVVIFETKKPSTKTDPDMVQAGNLKAKAMYQLVLYFLEERIQHNTSILNTSLQPTCLSGLFLMPHFLKSFFSKTKPWWKTIQSGAPKPR